MQADRAKNFVPIYEQARYKYLIYVEGHCAACRYSFLMRLGSVILKVTRRRAHAHTDEEKEGQHLRGLVVHLLPACARCCCWWWQVESQCVADQMWYFPLLRPYVDHVPVKADLSDLEEKIEVR